MNFTYYLYCECDFEKVVHQKENEVTLQCERCMNIEAKTRNHSYDLQCLACGEKKSIGNNVEFGENFEETCASCGLKGAIGFEKQENTLFILETNQEVTEPCSGCKQTQWKPSDESELTCPACFKLLKQRMSLMWESEEEKEE